MEAAEVHGRHHSCCLHGGIIVQQLHPCLLLLSIRREHLQLLLPSVALCSAAAGTDAGADADMCLLFPQSSAHQAAFCNRVK